MSIDSYVKVVILKMKESSGNEQFFVRLVRVDGDSDFLNQKVLELSCWQTKFLNKDECMGRAWFDASDAARFLGHKNMDKVELMNMTDLEREDIKKNMTFVFKD